MGDPVLGRLVMTGEVQINPEDGHIGANIEVDEPRG